VELQGSLVVLVQLESLVQVDNQAVLARLEAQVLQVNRVQLDLPDQPVLLVAVVEVDKQALRD